MNPVPSRPQPLRTGHHCSSSSSAGPAAADFESPILTSSPETSPPMSPAGTRPSCSSYHPRSFPENIIGRLRSRSRSSVRDHRSTNDDADVGAGAPTIDDIRAPQSPGEMNAPPSSATCPAAKGGGRGYPPDATDGVTVAEQTRGHSQRTVSASAASGQMERRKSSRSSGTLSDCGRHSNDWLFNGFSFRDKARGALGHLTQERRN